MVREDWAQQGTAMKKSSETIRAWLGSRKIVYAVSRPEKFNDKVRGADRETAVSIGNTNRPPQVLSFARLTELADRDDAGDIAVVALHPHEPSDCDALRRAYKTGPLDRLYVHIWARGNLARSWLEGRGAIDLYTGKAIEAPDPVQVAAGELIVDEEYNGLSTGNGKNTVIQILRSFSAEGYPLDADAWLRAYFAAGGTFAHAQVVENFVREVHAGKRHRVTPRLRPEIVGILRKRVTERPAE